MSGDLLSEGTGDPGSPRPQGNQPLWPSVLCWQDGGREGRASHARKALRPPRFSCHWGPLDAAAGLLPEAEADEQPPGPLRPCKNGSAWEFHYGSAVINLTSIHEVTSSSLGLAQWVQDPALL